MILSRESATNWYCHSVVPRMSALLDMNRKIKEVQKRISEKEKAQATGGSGLGLLTFVCCFW
jgi:hypothetical protein